MRRGANRHQTQSPACFARGLTAGRLSLAAVEREDQVRTVLVLDVQYPEAWTLEVPGDCPGESGGVTAVRENAGLTISNRGDRPALIEAIEISDIARPIDALVDAGGRSRCRSVRIPSG